MKKIRKLTAALLCALLALCLLTPVSAAGVCEVYASRSSATVGQGLTVTVTYSAGGSPLGAVTAMMTYDPSVLRYGGGSGTSGGNGSIRLVGVCDSADQTSLSFSVSFTAVGAGSSTLSVSTSELLSFDYDDLTPGTAQTQVTVSASSGGDVIPDLPDEPIVEPDPILVTVDGKEKHLLRSLAGVEIPADFEGAEDEYAGEIVSVARGINQDVLLMYLTDPNGTGGAFYRYDRATNTFRSFHRISVSAARYTVLSRPASVELPAGWIESTVTYGSESIPAAYRGGSEYKGIYLIYAADSSGNEGFYLFDRDNGAVLRYIAGDTKTVVVPNDPIATVGNLWNRLISDREMLTLVLVPSALLLLVAAAWLVTTLLRRQTEPSEEKAARQEKKMERRLERIEKRNRKKNQAALPDAPPKPEIGTLEEELRRAEQEEKPTEPAEESAQETPNEAPKEPAEAPAPAPEPAEAPEKPEDAPANETQE